MIEYRVKSKQKHHSALGREIKISPKSHIEVCEPGFQITYEKESVNLLIGIGKDHTATLVMSKDAWEALNKGKKISIDTLKHFKEIFIK